MFYSIPPHADLIFQDATQQLIVLKPEERHFSAYLGKDFMRARRIVDCHAGKESITASSVLTVLCSISTAILAIKVGRWQI